MRDVNVYFRHSALLTTESKLANSHGFNRFDESLAETLYKDFNYNLTHCVQFKLVKKLVGDKYDTQLLTVYLFPSLNEFKL